MTRPIVVFDTETATVRGAPHLLELGAVRIEDGEIAEHFEALVRPEVAIDPEAFAVHGIGDEDVRAARTAAEVLAAFVQFAGDDWLAAHDSRSDATVLGFEAARHRIELSNAPILDTLKLARRFIPESNDHKLETLAHHLELDVDVHHRALPDAVSCWKVLEECLARLETAHIGTSSIEARFAELLTRSGARTTLKGSGPKPPKLSQRLRPLEIACRERTRITLVYGEEGPPSNLAVLPRILFAMGDKGYLEAECERSSTIKTYRLDRIQRVLD